MYQIILIENNKKVKTLYTYTREHDALYRFTNINNKKVHFQKKCVYKNKVLTEVDYHVLLLKRRSEGDKSIIVRDNYGKLLEEFMEDPDWVVLGRSDYKVEEHFSVSGANRKLNAMEIIKHVLIAKISNKNTKQILILNNKVIIEGENLHLITCKNKDEAVRFYNKLRAYCFDNKINDVVFFGKIDKPYKKEWYKKIHEKTGVGYNRLYRSSSR